MPCSVTTIGVPYRHLAASAGSAPRPLVTACATSARTGGYDSGRRECSSNCIAVTASCSDGAASVESRRQSCQVSLSSRTAQLLDRLAVRFSVWANSKTSRSTSPKRSWASEGEASRISIRSGSAGHGTDRPRLPRRWAGGGPQSGMLCTEVMLSGSDHRTGSPPVAVRATSAKS